MSPTRDLLPKLNIHLQAQGFIISPTPLVNIDSISSVLKGSYYFNEGNLAGMILFRTYNSLPYSTFQVQLFISHEVSFLQKFLSVKLQIFKHMLFQIPISKL